MGSQSDWETMSHAAETLKGLQVPYEVRIVSAHRTPDAMFEYAATAEKRGLEVIIAGAGGAAHLPGMSAAKTVLPVLGVARRRFPAVNCPDARWRSGRNARHRQSGGSERGAPGRRNFRCEIPSYS